MNLLSPEVSILLGKELRQVRRSRAAVASATLLPLFLMTVMPLAQLFIARSAPLQPQAKASGTFAPPGMAEVADDPVQLLVSVMLPMFIVLGGLIVPSISATYTVVAEREKRTLDLLMALPVSVTDILVAKLLAMLVLAGVVVLPLFGIDMAVLVALGLISAPGILLLLVMLLAALGCSVGVALLLALLARDFRTANNLNGALLAATYRGHGRDLLTADQPAARCAADAGPGGSRTPGGARWPALAHLRALPGVAATCSHPIDRLRAAASGPSRR